MNQFESFTNEDLLSAEVQIRDRDDFENLKFYKGKGRLVKALGYALTHPEVWKISFDYDGKDYCFVKRFGYWSNRPLSAVADEAWEAARNKYCKK